MLLQLLNHNYNVKICIYETYISIIIHPNYKINMHKIHVFKLKPSKNNKKKTEDMSHFEIRSV